MPRIALTSQRAEPAGEQLCKSVGRMSSLNRDTALHNTVYSQLLQRSVPSSAVLLPCSGLQRHGQQGEATHEVTRSTAPWRVRGRAMADVTDCYVPSCMRALCLMAGGSAE